MPLLSRLWVRRCSQFSGRLPGSPACQAVQHCPSCCPYIFSSQRLLPEQHTHIPHDLLHSAHAEVCLQVPSSTLGTDLSSLLETGENADVTFTVPAPGLPACSRMLLAGCISAWAQFSKLTQACAACCGWSK